MLEQMSGEKSRKQRLSDELITFGMTRILREELAKECYEDGMGRVAVCQLPKRENQVKPHYIVVYIDNSKGPFQVLPNSGVDFRQYTNLGTVVKFIKRLGIDELFETINYDDLLKLERDHVTRSQ